MRSASLEADVLIGRKAEQEELAHALQSGRPELIAIFGRRRVGKTYLIRTFFKQTLCFELTGVRDASSNAALGGPIDPETEAGSADW